MPWIFARSWFLDVVVQRLGLLVGLVCLSDLGAQETIPVREPHSWLSDVPPALARLVDRGKVEIAVDQPAVDAANRTALTVFSFSLAYRMRYHMNEIAKDADGRPRARIIVSFFDIEVSPSHRILLSARYRPVKPWESALVQHEFDHVAISTDPRMFEMLRSLDGRKSTLILTPDETTKLSHEWAKNEIAKSARDFQQSVEKLVQKYYVRLDEVSNHGSRIIEDRKHFFTELYSIEDLEKMQYAYIDQIRKRLTEVDPEQIKEHYRLP